MTDLYHLFILVAILITGRADAVPERNRREGDQVLVSGQVGDYGGFSVNHNTEAQLGDEIAEGGAVEYQSLQAPNGLSFTGVNEAGESFGTEANAVAGYDRESQFNGGNTLGENNFVPPSGGFGFGNQLMAGAQAGFSNEVQIGKKSQNAELVQADAKDQLKLQAQFGQGPQYGGEIQTDFQENQGVQYSEVPSVLPPAQGLMQYPHGTTTGSKLNYGLVGPSVYSDTLKKTNTYKKNSMLVPYSKVLYKPGREPGSLYAVQSNTVPSNPTNAYKGPFVDTIPQPDRGIYTSISHSEPASTPNQQSLPISVSGYDVTQSPNWIPYQKVNTPNVYNNNKNWNPYTKPSDGETLIKVDGEIQSDGRTEAKTEVQENDKQTSSWSPYQKSNPLNVYNNNNNWNPYTKPAEGETLVQVDGDIQNGGKTEADIVVQENSRQNPNSRPYQKINPNKSLLQTDVVSPKGYNNNWNPYTKPAEGETLVKPDEEKQGSGETYANTVVQENGKQNNDWVPYQKVNPNKSLVQNDAFSSNSYDNNWNPYTKPAEGETLVQPDGEIQNGEKVEAAQESGKPLYQKGTQANSVVQTNKGLKVTGANAVAKTFAGYDGHYNSEIQPTLIGQINSGNQNERSTQTDILVQSNGSFQYSGENKATDAERQANIASSYSGGSLHNRETQNSASQTNEGIMNGGAKNSESSLYVNSNKYNGRYLNGDGFQANEESHLKNGAQFGAAVDGNTVVQAGPVVEARFGQTTHLSRRPLLAFGHPRSRWHQG